MVAITLEKLNSIYGCNVDFNKVTFDDPIYFINKANEIIKKYSSVMSKFSLEDNELNLEIDLYPDSDSNLMTVCICKSEDDYIYIQICYEIIDIEILIEYSDFVKFFDNIIYIAKNFLINIESSLILKKDIITPFHSITKGTKISASNLCEKFNIDFEDFCIKYGDYIDWFDIEK